MSFIAGQISVPLGSYRRSKVTALEVASEKMQRFSREGSVTTRGAARNDGPPDSHRARAPQPPPTLCLLCGIFLFSPPPANLTKIALHSTLMKLVGLLRLFVISGFFSFSHSFSFSFSFLIPFRFSFLYVFLFFFFSFLFSFFFPFLFFFVFALRPLGPLCGPTGPLCGPTGPLFGTPGPPEGPGPPDSVRAVTP